MTDLICVDFASQEDLMLLDQLARSVARRQKVGVRQVILQGSGESQERRLETKGYSTLRSDGALKEGGANWR